MSERKETAAVVGDGRVFLTVSQAMSVLVYDADDVHSFRGGGGIIGADWKRADIRDLFERHRPEILGRAARSLGHGVGCIDRHGLVGFKTDADALAALEASLNNNASHHEQPEVEATP